MLLFIGSSGSCLPSGLGESPLGLVFGHNVYATAAVLAIFMAGLALGSDYFGRWGESHTEPIALHARIEFLIAATGALSLAGLAAVRSLYVMVYPAVNSLQPFLFALRFIGVAVVLFIPTFLMGGTLPILVRGLTRKSAELGGRVSQLYWIKTLGAVLGTLISGFILLPHGVCVSPSLALALLIHSRV